MTTELFRLQEEVFGDTRNGSAIGMRASRKTLLSVGDNSIEFVRFGDSNMTASAVVMTP
jgi:hypothetical protein